MRVDKGLTRCGEVFVTIDELAEVEESPNKLQEKEFDHENEMNPAESDFIVKAKDVFGDILQD